MKTRRYCSLALLLCAAPALAGCGGTNETSFLGEDATVDLGNAEQSLLYDEAFLWSMRDIPVCWVEEPTSATAKATVKDALTGQRSWARNGNVRFVGWGLCTSLNPVGIRIVEDDGAMWSKIPDSNDPRIEMHLDLKLTNKGWTQCTANGLTGAACLSALALHEFGHAITYHHEHLAEDDDGDLIDNWCNASAGGDTTGTHAYGAVDNKSIMNYCADSESLSGIDRRGTDRLYGAYGGDPRHAADYNGDGRDDLLCHDIKTGAKWIDRGNLTGTFNGTNWSRGASWCAGENSRFFKGDFDGDNSADFLCHDVLTGELQIDYADNDFLGTDWSTNTGWCTDERERMLIGDFTGDGRADVLCHSSETGKRELDVANFNGGLNGTQWDITSSWCTDDAGRQYVGDFDGDGKDDILCHNLDTGRLDLDFANASGNGHFNGTNSSVDFNFCDDIAGEVHIGDFDGDGDDDLLCHNADTGLKGIAYSNGSKSNTFGSIGWSSSTTWCATGARQLSVGDFNGDDRDDLLCHDAVTGEKWVDIASSGAFAGTNSTSNLSWCAHITGEMH